MTIREYLNAISDRADDTPDCACSVCLSARDAAAALAQLDNAERDMFDHETGIIRIVPDYQPGVDQPHHAPGWSDPVAAATPFDSEMATMEQVESLNRVLAVPEKPSPPSGT